METLRSICEGLGYKTQCYSGRGMYGKSCLGVYIQRDVGSVWTLAQELGQQDCIVDQPRSDNIGEDTIVYWPDEPWEVETA